MQSSDVLFVGKGIGAVAWYRTGLPSFTLGCDWITVTGRPPKLELVGGLKRGGLVMPEFSDYEVIIIQQPRGREWANKIRQLRKQGIVVLYEIDDYIHAIPKMVQHRNHEHFDRHALAEYEGCMKAASGLIVSTEFLAQRYRRYNRQVFICRNGVMAQRYAEFDIPDRDTINIGFAGGVGHEQSSRAWLSMIRRILNEFDNTRFISIGVPLADEIADEFPQRTLSIPGTQYENFPAALMNFDIALGPAGPGNFFKAKSDLRWLETGALGIPLVGDPGVYPDIEHLITGMHAQGPEDAYEAVGMLVSDEQTRKAIGINVRARIASERDIEVMSQQWVDAFIQAES